MFSFGQVVNGSFETWSQTTNPDSWTFEAGTDLTQDMTIVNDGASSMRVNVNTATQGNTDFRQSVPVVGGTVYDILIDVYQTDNLSRARIFAAGDTYQTYSDPTILNAWQTISYTYTALADGNEDFGLRFYDSAGFAGSSVMYIDNFRIVAQSTPSLAISSPTDGDILFSQDVDVAFSVQNFNVATPSTGDGYIVYNLDGAASIDKFNTTDISFSGLAFGAHTVNMELVDNAGASLSPSVTATVNFTISQIQNLPYTDSFNYTDAELLANQPAWTNYFTGDDVVISTNNLSYSTLNGFGNAASFDGAGADPAVDFTPISTGKIYSSFMLRVDTFDAAPSDGYFAILRNDAGSYVGRVYISPLSPTTYSIGVSGGNLDPTQVAPAVLNVGDTVFVVFNYDLVGDTVELWVNPTLGTAEPASDINTPSGSSGNTISQFLLRQDNPGATPALIFDELRIATTWADVTPSTLSTDSFATNDKFSVYPNPVNNGIVTIKSNSNSAINVTVFDILGKQVLKSNVSNNTLNVSTLKSGVYILNINQNNTSITKKLVIK
tara:strand:- start:838 stop:2490 length:1653 start_codon:yes stop_codon:yes gene_type:complete